MSNDLHSSDKEAGQSRVTLRDPASCAFPHELLTRRFGFGGIPLTAEEIARCLRARRLLRDETLDQFTVTCLPAPVRLAEGMSSAYTIRGRYHVEMEMVGRRVHIDGIAQELGSPGGTNSEVRVYVEGVLEGRSILLGRLGGNVNTFPVAASIAGDLAMTVTPIRWTTLKELRVDLWLVKARGAHADQETC